MAQSAAGTKRPMQQLFRQFIARIQAWRAARHRIRVMSSDVIPLMALRPAIHRDVTPTGVRVYSLCGSCGARLETSATLCEECAQRRSRLS
jgi:hypothetical protein